MKNIIISATAIRGKNGEARPAAIEALIAARRDGVAVWIFELAAADSKTPAIEHGLDMLARRTQAQGFTHAVYSMNYRDNVKSTRRMLGGLMFNNEMTPAETLIVGKLFSEQDSTTALGVQFLWAHKFFGVTLEEYLNEHV